MATDFTDYYKRVLANPTASAQAKAEAQTKLGGMPSVSPTPSANAQIDTSKAPALPSGSGNISATGAGAIANGQDRLKQIEDIKKQIADLEVQKQKQAEIEQKDAEKKSLLGKITDTISQRNATVANQKSAIEMRQEALNQTYAEMGITPEQIQKIGGLISEVSEFNKQIADLETKKQQDLDNLATAGKTTSFYGLEKNSLEKKWNSEISAKALQAGVKVQELQMIQGAYDDAKATAGELVKLATYDQQQKVADIEWALGAYQDLYTTMSNEEKTAWDRQYTMAKDELDRATTEQTNKFNLITDAANKGVNLSSLGTASYQEVADAYAKQVGSLQSTPDVIGSAETGYLQFNKSTGKWDRIPGTGKVTTPTIPGATITSEQLSPIAKAVYDGTISIKDITPTQRAEIAPELSAVGWTSAITKENKQIIGIITEGVSKALELWKKVPNKYKGQVQGRLATWTGARERNDKVQAFETQRGIVAQQLAKFIEKNRLSDKDRDFYMSLMVNLNQNTESVAKSGNEQLINQLNAYTNNQISELSGGDITSTKADLDYINSLNLK